jgi:hypothetical protein
MILLVEFDAVTQTMNANHINASGVFSMKWPTLASICFLLALPSIAMSTLALGQTPTIDRQVKGKPDTNINTGIFTTVREDCTAGPLPVVRLLTPPAHGKVTMKQGRLRATNVKQCLGMEVPAFVAIYRSAKDFIGQDNFTLEVTGAGGKSQIQRITVTIMGAGASQGI